MVDQKDKAQYYRLKYVSEASGVFKRYSKPELQLSDAYPPDEVIKCQKGALNHDYYAHDPATGIHVFEMLGARESQEDRVVTGSLEGFDRLSPSAKKDTLSAALNLTEAELEEKGQGKVRKCGATAISAVADDSGITFANLGDSTLYVVITDAQNRFKSFQRLNTLHQPDEPSEVQRLDSLERKKLTPDGRRLNYLGTTLAVSRAMGDTAFEYCGLSHDPEVGFVAYEALGRKEGDRVYMMTACDGLKDCLGQSNSEQKSERAVEKQFRAHFDGQPKELQSLMLRLATDADQAQIPAYAKADNVSVCLAEVGVRGETPKMMTVFDGHGGHVASEFCRARYPKNLQKALTAEQNNAAKAWERPEGGSSRPSK